MAGMKSLALAEAKKVLQLFPVHYAAIAAIGITTGCRIGEILLLRRFDLMTADGKLKAKIPFAKFKTRGGKEKRKKREKVWRNDV